MKKLIIAGGTGFLGKACTDYFKDKFERVIILTRGATRQLEPLEYVHWDAKTLGSWQAHIDQSDVLINLVGRSVDCRYTPKNKASILESRITSTRVLGEAIALAPNPPKLWLNSSTATIYRHSLDKEMCEFQGEIGTGFSVHVARRWEQEFFRFHTLHTRQVALRTSIVLGKDAGAFKSLKTLAQFWVGGPQGSGDQKFSWIHVQDFVRSLEYIIKHQDICGPVNIVAPQIITNTILMKIIRKAVGRSWGLPLSKTLLRIGAIAIQTEIELVLKSRNVIPKVLMDHGFTYNFPTLKNAIKTCL